MSVYLIFNLCSQSFDGFFCLLLLVIQCKYYIIIYFWDHVILCTIYYCHWIISHLITELYCISIMSTSQCIYFHVIWCKIISSLCNHYSTIGCFTFKDNHVKITIQVILLASESLYVMRCPECFVLEPTFSAHIPYLVSKTLVSTDWCTVTT